MDRNESAPAIVIKSERYRERDRILTLLSPVWGLRRVIVYGAQKSRKAVKASLCTEGVFHVYNNKERHQVSLVDINVISIHENALSSLASSFASSLMCEVILMQRGEDAPLWYDLLAAALDSLDDGNYRNVVIQFMIKAVDIEGLATGLSCCPVCGKAYGEKEILGFSADIASPCCSLCDTMHSVMILPVNARRYIKDSQEAGFAEGLSFIISGNMASRLMRYCIRWYNLANSCSLKSAAALLELDNLG